MLLNNLALFLLIVEKGGMAAAGREMGLSPATVSERLASLERHYGTRLLIRTTRAISLTDEGRTLVDGAKRLLAESDELETRIRLGAEKLSGPIRISAPIDLGRNRIALLLDEFLDEHPDVSIDLRLSDGYIDLVAQGIDLAFRYGALDDSTLRVKKLADSQRIVCAAPSYLKVRGTPEHPDDLSRHNCILMRFGNEVDHEWRFQIEGREKKFTVRGNRIANDGDLVGMWCRSGHGIALKSIWDVQDDLTSGRLVRILEGFTLQRGAVQIVYPAGEAQPRRIRMLIDHFSSRFDAERM